MKINNKTDFTKTLNLQKQTILMDGNLTKREGYFLEKMQDTKKYNELITFNTKNNAKRYRLAELPIYIEDRVNPTTVLNKIIKDIVIRRKLITGNLIEHNVLFTNTGDITKSNTQDNKDIVKTRIAGKKKLADVITKQILEINDLGTLLNYEKHNISSSMSGFENIMIDEFLKLYEKGIIKREQRPVNWCINCKMSYGRHDIKYKKSKVDNVYVLYKVKDDKSILAKYNNLKNTYFIASTIRPWVLVSNNYIALNETGKYELIEVEKNGVNIHYIVEKELASEVMQQGFYIRYNVKETFEANELNGVVCENPLDYTKTLEVILTKKEYVDFDEKNNTGIQIVSSGHTFFDYLILKNGKEKDIHSVINEEGKLNNLAIVYKDMLYKETNAKIIEFLKKADLLYATTSINVKLPYCEMCNEELIYRHINEWYLKKNENNIINENMLNEIFSKTVTLNGNDKYIASLVHKINNINQIVISDEKIVGTPIPVFYCADCGRAIIDKKTIEILKKQFATKGVDSWYKLSPEEMLQGQISCVCGCGFFFKENSTIGDFFKLLCASLSPKDENVEGLCVENKKEFAKKILSSSFKENFIYDYINVSHMLIHEQVYEKTKTIAKPNFFIEDDKEDKKDLIKKDLGIRDIVKKYGTDVLRLWSFKISCNKNIMLTEQVIIDTNRIYNKIRQVFKFILSNVYDFNPSKESIHINDRTDLDKFMYVKLKNFVDQINKSYEELDFKTVYTKLIDFCINDLINLYFDMIKYSLYVLNPKDKERLSTQSTLYDILYSLISICEPILPFTCEEIWPFIWHKNADEEKNLLLFRYVLENVQDEFEIPRLKWKNILFIRNNLNKYLKEALKDKVISNTLEAKIIITTNENTKKFIENNYDTIVKAMNISSIDAKVMDIHKIKVVKESGTKCARCGHYNINVGQDLNYRYLCPNCAKILSEKD